MSEPLEIIGHITQIRPSDILFEFKKDDSVAIGSVKIEDIKVCIKISELKQGFQAYVTTRYPSFFFFL
jgi:hypothetical protein